MNKKKVALAIPTYNAGVYIEEVLNCILKNRDYIDTIKIFDSQSTDNTLEIVKKKKLEYEVWNKKNFSHSGTRTKIARNFYEEGYDYLIFLTQDVYLEPNAIKIILEFVKFNDLSMAYGRQIVDMKKGNIFEKFARSHNYPEISTIKSKSDIESLGIKTIFASDAFSIYKLSTLDKFGYFGSEVDYAEDMVIAHKLIQANYRVGYCASAQAYHTHNYSLFEEYKRYEITGKFHKENIEMIESYGKVNSQGANLAINEIKYLISEKKFYLVPESIIRNSIKYIGLNVGKMKK